MNREMLKCYIGGLTFAAIGVVIIVMVSIIGG